MRRGDDTDRSRGGKQNKGRGKSKSKGRQVQYLQTQVDPCLKPLIRECLGSAELPRDFQRWLYETLRNRYTDQDDGEGSPNAAADFEPTNKTAPGDDGWRVFGLKALPVHISDRLAVLLNIIDLAIREQEVANAERHFHKAASSAN